jgi:alpha-tubulin suppressor-like RCC1 family protein
MLDGLPMTLARFVTVILLAACCGACDDPADVDILRIELVSGGQQTAGQGVELGMPIVVRFLDRNDNPVTDAAVQWRVIEGGGSLLMADERTGADGTATARWSLGTGIGQNLLLVSAPGASLTVRADGRRAVTAVFAGGRHTCALTTTGDAYCWGDNSRGQLGDGTTASRSTPRRVATVLKFRTLSLGWATTCGITADATFCWGDNGEGQLGAGLMEELTGAPQRVLTDARMATVSAGYVHACGITTDGTALCWGANPFGQLGTNGMQSTRVPVPVAGDTRFRHISAGEFHTCAIGVDSLAWCWGFNGNRELGNGPLGGVVSSPARVSGSTRFDAITAGIRHTCAVAADGGAYCWGRNGWGETGTPPFVHPAEPVRVSGSSLFEQIQTGNTGTCATTADAASAVGSIECWGRIGPLVLGPVPVRVLSSSDGGIAVGYDHACAVQQGNVWCWGSNEYGQLGVSGLQQAETPIRSDPID